MYMCWILLCCIIYSKTQAMTCPNISFQTSPSGANNAHGSQTMNLTTGIKTITCDDGPSGIGALLSFKYNDGNDAGLQEGSLSSTNGSPITLNLKCQNGQWTIIDYGSNFVLASLIVHCETTCTKNSPYVIVVNLKTLNSSSSSELKPNRYLSNSIPIKSYGL